MESVATQTIDFEKELNIRKIIRILRCCRTIFVESLADQIEKKADTLREED